MGASSSAERAQLSQDGDTARCDESSATDTNPPAGCQALLRLEVVELTGEAPPPKLECPEGTEPQGDRCIRSSVVTEVTCPSGATWDGKTCVAKVDKTCPVGLSFVEGRGCLTSAGELEVEAAARHKNGVQLYNKDRCTEGMKEFLWVVENGRKTKVYWESVYYAGICQARLEECDESLAWFNKVVAPGTTASEKYTKAAKVQVEKLRGDPARYCKAGEKLLSK